MTESATPTPFHLRVDFISDVVCPWCVIGLRGLQQALQQIGDDVVVEIRFHPFELNPHMAAEGENAAEHVEAKYGSTPEQSEAARYALKQRGAELGFTFNYGPQSRIWNSFDAHRLLHWAALEGKQTALKEALFKAAFTDQLSISDHDVLIVTAAGVGLNAARAREILSTGEYAGDVRRIETAWRQRGVNAVPSIIFNQKWMLQGGQPPAVFENIIRDIVAGTVRGA